MNNKNLTLKIFDFIQGSLMDANGDVMKSSLETNPVFPAPEYGVPVINDKKADIWACGVVLYYMVFNALPFEKFKIPIQSNR